MAWAKVGNIKGPKGDTGSGGGSGAPYPLTVSQYWFLPIPTGTQLGSGAASTANVIAVTPFILNNSITIDSLGARVANGVSGSTCALAIYAHSASSGCPTGTPVAQVNGLSSASNGIVSGTTQSPVSINPGLYWMAVNESSTAAFTAAQITFPLVVQLIGVTPLSKTSTGAAGSGPSSMVSSSTYSVGTWPDFSSVSAGDGTFVYPTSAQGAVIYMRAA